MKIKELLATARVHLVACSARGQCLCADALQERRRGPVWASSVNAAAWTVRRSASSARRRSLVWTDYQPNELRYEVQGEPARIMHHGMPYLSEGGLAGERERLGALHTEGLTEVPGQHLPPGRSSPSTRKNPRRSRRRWPARSTPTSTPALEGVRWIETCVRSAEQRSRSGSSTNNKPRRANAGRRGMKLSICTDLPRAVFPRGRCSTRSAELGCCRR